MPTQQWTEIKAVQIRPDRCNQELLDSRLACLRGLLWCLKLGELILGRMLLRVWGQH